MLGKFGETLVVDWGLAKVVGRGSEDGTGAVEEKTLRPAAERGCGGTLAGSAVGTPAFMSPEQAAGKVEELGPTTDVYSLGATLYMLLTNEPPLRGELAEVLRGAQEGSWLPSRQVNPAVPAALDAICRKAMALRPADRYGSALDLAKDAERWLGDEPVAAYPEPWGVRLRRWMRKHSRLVTVAAAVLVTAVVGLTVGMLLLQRSKEAEQKSREMAEKQADYFIEEVCENPFLKEPGMQQVRRQMLLSVIQDYEEFLKKRPGDLRARQQLAKARRQLGEVYGELEYIEEARTLVDQARNGYEQLLRESPADRELRFGMAQVHLALAELQAHAGEPEEGKKEANRAIDLLEGLKAEEPWNVRFLNRLVRGYNAHATAETELGNLEAGVADIEHAYDWILVVLSVAQDTNVRTPQNRPPQFETFGTHYGQRERMANMLLAAHVLTTRGILLEMAGRTTEGAWVLREAPHVFPWLVEKEALAVQHSYGPLPVGGTPNESRLLSVGRGRVAGANSPGELSPLKPQPRAQLRHGLSVALLHAGHAEVGLGLPARAEPALRAALEGLRELVRDDPRVPDYAANWLLACGYLGEDLYRRGRTAPAAQLLRAVGEQGDKVLGGPRKSRLLRAQHARLLHVLGCLEQETGNIDSSLRTHERVRGLVERALREAPGDSSLQGDWLGNREALAHCRFLRGDFTREQWIDKQKEIVAKRGNLADQGPPPSPRFQGELAASASLLASLLLEAGRAREALACIDGVLKSYEPFMQDEPLRAKDLTAARDTPAELASVPATALANTFFFPFHSASMYKPLVPESLELRRRWAALLAQRGRALAQLRRGGEAVEPVSKAIRLTEELLRGGGEVRCPPASPASVWCFFAEELYRQEPCYLYDRACYLALASTLDRAAGIADPAGEAVEALRDYVASGFDNPHKLRTDPALEPLRKRDDFQKLQRELEAVPPGREQTP
jgi:tetratricopeptide (TPR) repeat protein